MASAAAVVARARRRVLDHLFAQNAVTPEHAQPFTADRPLMQRQFDRLRAKGVIREAKPGSYYVDVPSWHAWQTAMRQRILVVVVAAMVAGFVAAFFAGHGR